MIDLARGEVPFSTVEHGFGRLRLDEVVRRGFNYSERAGSMRLRQVFVERLARSASDTGETLVCHGALGAIDLALRSWPARRFVCFEPTYREALAIARMHGLPIATIPERLAGRLGPSDVVYVIPALNNPDGRTLDEDERRALAEAITSSGAALIEDDTYGTLAPTDGTPSILELVRRENDGQRALRLVSFSKIAMPGARCCVVEGPRAVLVELAARKVDFGTCPLACETMAALLADEAAWAAVVGRIRERLDAGRHAALAGLAEWPGECRGGGYFLWLPTGEMDSDELVAASREHLDVKLVGGRGFLAHEGRCNFVRLSVAWEPPALVREACELLSAFRRKDVLSPSRAVAGRGR
jgi:GntR family transcriptional regulator, regulator for abcA and norABC